MVLCLPIDFCRSLNDRPVNGRAADSSEAFGRFTDGVPAKRRPDPWHRKPRQRDRLKREAKPECGLIGHNRIVPVVRQPLLDHEPNTVLHREGPAKVQRAIQSAIGARGKFFRGSKSAMTAKLAPVAAPAIDTIDQGRSDGRGMRETKTSSAAMNSAPTPARQNFRSYIKFAQAIGHGTKQEGSKA